LYFSARVHYFSKYHIDLAGQKKDQKIDGGQESVKEEGNISIMQLLAIIGFLKLDLQPSASRVMAQFHQT
jgi:hypothetical protein